MSCKHVIAPFSIMLHLETRVTIAHILIEFWSFLNNLYSECVEMILVSH